MEERFVTGGCFATIFFCDLGRRFVTGDALQRFFFCDWGGGGRFVTGGGGTFCFDLGDAFVHVWDVLYGGRFAAPQTSCQYVKSLFIDTDRFQKNRRLTMGDILPFVGLIVTHQSISVSDIIIPTCEYGDVIIKSRTLT